MFPASNCLITISLVFYNLIGQPIKKRLQICIMKTNLSQTGLEISKLVFAPWQKSKLNCTKRRTVSLITILIGQKQSHLIGQKLRLGITVKKVELDFEFDELVNYSQNDRPCKFLKLVTRQRSLLNKAYVSQSQAELELPV